MKDILNGEILPRRVSSQFLPIKKRKLCSILKWVDLEKKSNKKNQINIEFSKKKRKKNFKFKFHSVSPISIQNSEKSFPSFFIK